METPLLTALSTAACFYFLNALFNILQYLKRKYVDNLPKKELAIHNTSTNMSIVTCAFFIESILYLNYHNILSIINFTSVLSIKIILGTLVLCLMSLIPMAVFKSIKNYFVDKYKDRKSSIKN